MENTEAKIYSEVYALIQLAGKDYQDMLPDKVKKSINLKRDKGYTPIYNINIPLEKQNIQKDSLAILANIQYNYWCTTEQEKRDFIKELEQIDIDNEKRIREKYNPDNIFKKQNSNIEKSEETALVQIEEENWKNKIIKFFNKLLQKIKLK